MITANHNRVAFVENVLVGFIWGAGEAFRVVLRLAVGFGLVSFKLCFESCFFTFESLLSLLEDLFGTVDKRATASFTLTLCFAT